MDFTYKGYRRALYAFKEAGYTGVNLVCAATQHLSPPLLILRHDVEWNAKRAWELAKVEEDCGFSSSFHVRMDTNAYDLDIMNQLQDKGFDVGYHYNTLDRCGGNFTQAIELFEQELGQMKGQGINVRTVSAHSDPRIKKIGYHGNIDILEKDPDCYARNHVFSHSLIFDRYSCEYMADYGVRWTHATSTDELIRQMKEGRWPIIYMLTHPDYWSGSILRAVGLQLAGRSLRLFKLNRIVANCRSVFKN